MNARTISDALLRLSDVSAVTGADLKYAREALGLSLGDEALILGHTTEHLERLEACKFACGFTRRALLGLLKQCLARGAGGTN